MAPFKSSVSTYLYCPQDTVHHENHTEVCPEAVGHHSYPSTSCHTDCTLSVNRTVRGLCYHQKKKKRVILEVHKRNYQLQLKVQWPEELRFRKH